ncbi:MAG: hypothetical protein WC792_06480 [Candidatus Micrarchaeia archaeon]|jgi:hypothetical protein
MERIAKPQKPAYKLVTKGTLEGLSARHPVLKGELGERIINYAEMLGKTRPIRTANSEGRKIVLETKPLHKYDLVYAEKGGKVHFVLRKKPQELEIYQTKPYDPYEYIPLAKAKKNVFAHEGLQGENPVATKRLLRSVESLEAVGKTGAKKLLPKAAALLRGSGALKINEYSKAERAAAEKEINEAALEDETVKRMRAVRAKGEPSMIPDEQTREAVEEERRETARDLTAFKWDFNELANARAPKDLVPIKLAFRNWASHYDPKLDHFFLEGKMLPGYPLLQNRKFYERLRQFEENLDHNGRYLVVHKTAEGGRDSLLLAAASYRGPERKTFFGRITPRGFQHENPLSIHDREVARILAQGALPKAAALDREGKLAQHELTEAHKAAFRKREGDH